MLDQYSILQSGFISVANPKLTRPSDPPTDSSFDAFILNKAFNIDTNSYFYHSGVDSLSKEYLNNPLLGKDFDFREKAFLEFKDALGTKNIVEWLMLQSKNQHLSALHSQFLNDMLIFVSGRVRTMQSENWGMIISKDSSFNKSLFVPVDINKYFNPNSGIYNLNSTIYKFLASWLSQPNGFDDFITTIGIIFGEQTGTHTVV
jgi:hypothetical protein